MDKNNAKILVNCKYCKGKGVIKHRLCQECGGHGYKIMDKQKYYRQLRSEQKARMEMEK